MGISLILTPFQKSVDPRPRVLKVLISNPVVHPSHPEIIGTLVLLYLSPRHQKDFILQTFPSPRIMAIFSSHHHHHHHHHHPLHLDLCSQKSHWKNGGVHHSHPQEMENFISNYATHLVASAAESCTVPASILFSLGSCPASGVTLGP